MCDLVIENEKARHENKDRTVEMFDLINVRNACTVFALISFEDFRNIHKKAKTKGLVAEHLGFKIATFCMCGRIMITLSKSNDPERYISMLGSEDGEAYKSIAGIHGINCESDIAIDWLENLTDNWYQFYDKRTKDKSFHVDLFKESNNVMIA